MKKVREIGKEYKIIYLGKTSTRNGVRTILIKYNKEKMVEVIRENYRVIMVREILEEG